MKNYTLKIAGYKIRFETSDSSTELTPAVRFHRNICKESRADIQIRVHIGSVSIPENAEMVFHAPYFEEINGLQIANNMDFWCIMKYQSDLYIKTIFPLSISDKKGLLKFSLTDMEWDLWINDGSKEIDPLEYPLDGLILYYLTVIHGDIMIHASGINNIGHGYLFSGVSGKGKSTIAKIWENSGGKIIHDDRLIIRKTSTGYMMYNTPIYNDDKPKESPLDKIFIIGHGKSNILKQLKGADAVSQVMANCIQHNWGSDIIARLLGSISIMCNTIPVAQLFFKPDRSVIDHIFENE